MSVVSLSPFAVAALSLAGTNLGCSVGDVGGGAGGVPLPAAPTIDSGEGAQTGTDASAEAGPGQRDLSSNRLLFFGASRCPRANVLLCEDFESGNLDASRWTSVGTAPAIDTLQKARGNRALHIVQQGPGSSYIRETSTFPAEDDHYFGRAFYYFKQLPTAVNSPGATWSIVAASGTGSAGEIRVGGELTADGLTHFAVGTDSGDASGPGTGNWLTADQDPYGTPIPVPLQQWVCVEWEHDGSTNSTRFFWDTVEHTSLHTTSSVHGGNGNPYVLPTFSDLAIGWAEYAPSTETFELWVDEIAIDKERIGCVI